MRPQHTGQLGRPSAVQRENPLISTKESSRHWTATSRAVALLEGGGPHSDPAQFLHGKSRAPDLPSTIRQQRLRRDLHSTTSGLPHSPNLHRLIRGENRRRCASWLIGVRNPPGRGCRMSAILSQFRKAIQHRSTAKAGAMTSTWWLLPARMILNPNQKVETAISCQGPSESLALLSRAGPICSRVRSMTTLALPTSQVGRSTASSI